MSDEPGALAHPVTPLAAPPGRTNTMAVLSLVFGLLGAFFGVFAVVFGHVALGQIRRRGEGGRGLAIAGLVLGYVGTLFGLFVLLYLRSALFGLPLLPWAAATIHTA